MTDGQSVRKRTHGNGHLSDSRAYNDVLEQVLRIATQMTLEIDQTPYPFVDHVIEGLELGECVRLIQGQTVRKCRRNYYAYMTDSNTARPDVGFTTDLYDRACDAELSMRARGALECPHCTPHDEHEHAHGNK